MKDTEFVLDASDRLAIGELIARYAWASDGRDFVKLADCFTEDGEFVLEPGANAPAVRVVGRDAIASWVHERHIAEFARGDRRRHMTTCLVVEPLGIGCAVARSYLQVLISDPDGLRTAVMGWYHDEVSKVDGVWRFSRRTVHIEARR